MTVIIRSAAVQNVTIAPKQATTVFGRQTPNVTVVPSGNNAVTINSRPVNKLVLQMRGPPGLARQDFGFSLPGVFPNPDEVIMTMVASRQNTWDASQSVAICGMPPAADWTLLIKKNSVSVGEILFEAGIYTGVVSFSDPAQVRGDVFTLVTPSIVDLQISDLAITLAGSY
jgi:hypothetical protein